MKRAILLLYIVFFSIPLSAREVININRNWRFFSSIERRTSDGAQIVNLPHTWSNDALSGSSYYFRGTGNYMKDIRIPRQWQNKRVFIRFGGAGTVASLFLNGRHVGEHRGGYTAFTFEITSYLKYGSSNFFWVVVNNSPQMDVLPTAGDINIYGGLYRDVELIVTEPSAISLTDYSSDGVYLIQRKISREKAEMEANVKIDGLPDRNLTINLAVMTPRGDTVITRSSRLKVPNTGKGSVSIPFEMDNPVLWDGLENPYMYEVGVEVYDGNFLQDRISVPLGLRTFAVDPQQGFILNGNPYRIKGVVAYEDRASAGNALRSYQIKEDLDIIQEMGANAVRAAAYPHNKHFYEECDRRGILVWSDLPFLGPSYMTDKGYIDMPSFEENGHRQLVEMIRQLYNSPSIFGWGLFSHLNQRGDDPKEYIEALQAVAMAEDPTRLTVANSNNDGSINFITDLIVWNQIFGWLEGQPSDIGLWLNTLKANWGNLRSGISYGAGASIYHQTDSLYRPSIEGNFHPERWQTYLHEQYYPYVNESPWLWGWFIRNMFDYGAAGRTWGDGSGVEDSGLVTFDHKYRKDAYYFYKANWKRDTPVLYITERRWDRRSDPVQNIRVYSNQDGIELFVNGVSQGTQHGKNSVFSWEKVRLQEGENLIEARSGTEIDRITVFVSADVLNHNIN